MQIRQLVLVLKSQEEKTEMQQWILTDDLRKDKGLCYLSSAVDGDYIISGLLTFEYLIANNYTQS